MELRFGIDDEDAFFAARERLIDDFHDWLAETGQDDDLGSDGELMLDFKWGYAGGDLGWWRRGHLDEFLLDWYPRKVSLTPEFEQLVIPSVAAFLRYLDARGYLTPASDPVDELVAHVESLGDAFHQAVNDPSRFGMAKRLFAGMGAGDLDISDPAEIEALMERFNALPFEERGRILGLAGQDAGGAGGRFGGRSPRRFPPVVIAPRERLEQAAQQARWPQRLRTFTRWVGDGRAVTDRGDLELADARELVELLGTDDEFDPAIGSHGLRTTSSVELPGVDLTYRWAREAGLVKLRHGILTRTQRGQAYVDDGAVLDLLPRMLRALLDRVGVASRHAGGDDDWLAEATDAYVHEWLADLYEYGPAELEDLAEDLREELRATYDLSDVAPMFEYRLGLGLDRDARRVFGVLDGLGIVRLTEVVGGPLGGTDPDGQSATEATGGLVELTELGVAILQPWMAAYGQAPVAGELADLEVDALLARAPDLPAELARAEIGAWLDARGRGAIAELAGALTSARGSSLVLGLQALLDVSEEAAPTMLAMRDHDTFGPYATVWAVDALALDVESVATDDPARQAAILGAVVDWRGPGPVPVWLGLVSGSDDQDMPEVVAAWWNLPGDHVTEVLEAVAQHDHRKPVAKAARKALYRRRSRPT